MMLWHPAFRFDSQWKTEARAAVRRQGYVISLMAFWAIYHLLRGMCAQITQLWTKMMIWRWGMGSVVKSIHHSYRGCELGPQHPCEVAHKPSNSSSGGMQYLLHHLAPILVHIPSTQTHAYTQLKIVKHFKRRIIRIRSLRFICFLINCVLPHKSSM